MWFGCHPLRADFIKRRLPSAYRQQLGVLWDGSVHQSPLIVFVVFARQTPSDLQSHPPQPQRQQHCWQFLWCACLEATDAIRLTA